MRGSVRNLSNLKNCLGFRYEGWNPNTVCLGWNLSNLKNLIYSVAREHPEKPQKGRSCHVLVRRWSSGGCGAM